MQKGSDKGGAGGQRPAGPMLLSGYPYPSTQPQRVDISEPKIKKVITALTAHSMPLHFQASMHHPISFADPKRFMPVPSANSAHLWGMLGSHYVSNDGAKKEIQLEAIQTSLTYSESKVTSMCVTNAKGTNAQRICQVACQFLTESLNPDDLSESVVRSKLLATARTHSRQYILEPSIFGGAKIFRDREGKFHLCSFNAGSGLVAVYNPFTKELVHALPAREITAEADQLGDLSDKQLLVGILNDLPAGCLLLVMTRGVTQAITIKSDLYREEISIEEIKYNYNYHEYILNQLLLRDIFRLLEPDDPVENYARALMDYATLTVDRKRAVQTNEHKVSVLGDDLSITIARISPLAFDQAFRLCVVPFVFTGAEKQLDVGQAQYRQFLETKDINTYQEGMRAFLEAAALFHELDNHIGQIRAYIYSGDLSYSMHSVCYGKKPFAKDSPDYRIKKIQHAQKVLALWQKFAATSEVQCFTNIGFLISDVVSYFVSTAIIIAEQFTKNGYQASELAGDDPGKIKEAIGNMVRDIITGFPQRCSRIVSMPNFNARPDKQELLDGLIEFTNWVNTNIDLVERTLSMSEVKKAGFTLSPATTSSHAPQNKFRIDGDAYAKIASTMSQMQQNAKQDNLLKETQPRSVIDARAEADPVSCKQM